MSMFVCMCVCRQKSEHVSLKAICVLVRELPRLIEI